MSDIQIVAEIGCNHNGSVELAKKMMKKAKEAGADAVKFQSFVPENLVSRYAPKAEYQKKNDGNGKIIVAFNNTRKPVRDYYFESSTSNYSKIKNKDILIYQYENTYYTEFKDNGIYYDIESHNVSLEDFKYILEIVIE